METKKKVLVYIGSFFPYEDAITNVTLPFLEKLKERFDVDVYTRSRDGKAPIDDNIMGYRVFRDKVFNGSKKREFLYKLSRDRRLNFDVTDHQNHFILKQIYVKMLNLLDDKQWHNFINRNEKEKWEQEFSEVLRSKNYSIVFSVSSHIQTQTDALQQAQQGYFKKHHIIWIAYFVDPFSTYIRNLKNPNNLFFQRFETKVYELADAVFTSPEMYEDNQNYLMGKYRYKTVPIQYASMKPLVPVELYEGFDDSKINVLYTGSFFDVTVRNPEYFFKLISKIDNALYQFHIVCNMSNSTVDRWKAEYFKGRDNIHWYQGKSLKECQAMVASADVLINIGNETVNQTPSKVFDYIGSCKHIVNFYSLEQDTSKHYLEKYDNHINIKNNIEVNIYDLNRFIEFANLSKREEISMDKIWSDYAEFTSEYLANQFIGKFMAVVESKGRVYEADE